MSRPFLLLCFVWLISADSLVARSWTDQKGARLEADLVRVEGTNVILRIKGKETPVALEKLSAADQAWVAEWQTTQKKTQEAALAERLTFGGTVLEPGKASAFDLPLLPDESKEIKLATNGGLEAASIKACIAVPVGFDPSKPTPLLLVSSTTDGDGSSIRVLKNYLSSAMEKNWIVIAADGPAGKPTGKGDTPSYRFALQERLLREIHAKWPGSALWPMAHAGFSGGGGYASYGTIWHSNQGKNLIGLLLEGSGWTPRHFIGDLKKTANFRKVPVFYSIGDKDKVTTPELAKTSLAAIKEVGSRILREEHFDGAHERHIPHIGAALTWFMEQQAAAGK
jgi:hypothetical protein